MSVISRANYQEFLSSDYWQKVRFETLVSSRGLCHACFTESVFNDAHHFIYPKDGWYKTEPRHLAILCRDCHDIVHGLLPASNMPDSHASCIRMFQAIRDWITDENPKAAEFKAKNPELVRDIQRRNAAPQTIERKLDQRRATAIRKACMTIKSNLNLASDPMGDIQKILTDRILRANPYKVAKNKLVSRNVKTDSAVLDEPVRYLHPPIVF